MKSLINFIKESVDPNDNAKDLLYICIDLEQTNIGGSYMIVCKLDDRRKYFDCKSFNDVKLNDVSREMLSKIFRCEPKDLEKGRVVWAGNLSEDEDDQYPVIRF